MPGTTRRSLPGFAVGSGPPLVYLPPLAFTHEVPRGAIRWYETYLLRPLVARFRVHWLGRRIGSPADFTIADHARDAATAIERRFGFPVPVVGFSTGAFVGFQLAIDHPGQVSGLVAIGAGSRLSDAGRQSTLRWADALAADHPGEAWRETVADLTWVPAIASALRPLLGLLGPVATPKDCADAIRTARTEAHYDASAGLSRISAPTLIITGEKDRNCDPAMARETAAAIPGSQLVVLPNTGHAGSLTHPRALSSAADFLSD